MGRKKLEVKRIQDKSSRQVAFSKRRSGLVNKAKELSILCDVEVALIVFSTSGRMYQFCSSGSSLSDMLEHYRSCIKSSSTLAEAESGCVSMETSTELVQTVERCLDGTHLDDLSVNDYVRLEKQLDDALVQTRGRKNQLLLESMMSLQEQARMVKEENEVLENKVEELVESKKKAVDDGVTFNKLVEANSSHQPVSNRETLPLLKLKGGLD